MYKVILMGAVLVLSGCKTLEIVGKSTMPGAVVSQENGDYKLVSMSPNYLIAEKGDWGVNKLSVAATWNSKAPEIVKLRFVRQSDAKHDDTLYFNLTGSEDQQNAVEKSQEESNTVNVTEMNVSFNNQTYKFQNEIAHYKQHTHYDGYVDSIAAYSNVVEVPISILENMVNTDNCILNLDWYEIEHPDEKFKRNDIKDKALFSEDESGSGASIARTSFKEFLKEIKAS